MGKGPWCAGLPMAKVQHGDELEPLTLIVPYYDNPVFLETQGEVWRSYPSDLASLLTVIVVDDGSPVPCALPRDLPCSVRLFRIGVDVRWNWLAARNIGAHHADDGWLLLTDMDHVVPSDTLRSVMSAWLDPSTVYAFSRREHTGEPVTPHSASFLMTKDTFWKVGGYDEVLSGHYGTDGDYRRRLATVAPIQVLPDALIRHEYVADSSTVRYKRKQPEDAAVSRLIAKRGKGWRPRVLSFPYAEVSA